MQRAHRPPPAMLVTCRLGPRTGQTEEISQCARYWRQCRNARRGAGRGELARSGSPYRPRRRLARPRPAVSMARARYGPDLAATLPHAVPTPPYFSVMASPLRSTFASNPTCRPVSSSTAPFWLVSTIPRAPVPTASPAPAAP